MVEEIRDKIRLLKNHTNELEHLEDDVRNLVLDCLADLLEERADEILQENFKDLSKMDRDNPTYDRLLLSKERLFSIASDVRKVSALPTILGKVIDSKILLNGIELSRVVVPFGIVGVIYESRPNVTVDIFSLCFKSGNCCILKGGKEAYHSNMILVSLIKEALSSFGVSPDIIYFLSVEREQTEVLLDAKDMVDVIIPRGSRALIDYVQDRSKVPVLETGAGVVHIYVDSSADLDIAKEVIDNSKTRRPSVCNSLDCLLVARSVVSRGKLFEIVEALSSKGVELYADAEAYKTLKDKYKSDLLHVASKEHYGMEFLSKRMALKIVSNVQEGCGHISEYSSKHTECILAEDIEVINYFKRKVDSGVIFVNTSTSFSDGGEFGFGSEIGISTQKFHARGPMGLEALTSYKWIGEGRGQIRK